MDKVGLRARAKMSIYVCAGPKAQVFHTKTVTSQKVMALPDLLPGLFEKLPKTYVRW